MAAIADKFSRLAALKPARPVSRQTERRELRAPGEEDPLAQLLGAGIVKNYFGEHLAVRNWFSTPEYAEPSAVSLELLSRTRDRSEEHTSELQSQSNLVCRLLLEKKKNTLDSL